MARRRVGRMRIGFDVIERFAAQWIANGGYNPGAAFSLSVSSSLHRRKDGSYTVVLIWKAKDCQIVETVRGLRLEAA